MPDSLSHAKQDTTAMFGHRGNTHEDDEDVEIVDLDVFVAAEQQAKPPAAVKRSSLAPRFSDHQRYVQLLVTSGLVVLTLFALLLGNATSRSKVLSLIMPATPGAMGTQYFYVAGSPRWGHLYIDGKLIAHPPDPVLRQNPPLSLPPGKHVIRWVAAPFQQQQCSLTEPPDFRTDTCQYNHYMASTAGIGAWLLNFPANLSLLTPTLQTSLVSTVQAALDEGETSTNVLPGELYAVESTSHQLQVAAIPMKATLRYWLDTNTAGSGICSTPLELNLPCIYDGQECHTFCTVRLFPDSVDAWDMLVVAHANWTYSLLNGQVVAQGPEIVGDANFFEHFLPVRVTWDGTQWHAALSFSMLPSDMQQFFDPACNTAMNHERMDMTESYVTSLKQATSWRYVGGLSPAWGCLGMVTLKQGPDAAPGASQAVAYCLHRFGIFVAANSIAHTYWPTMPVADTYEQHLAQQLAASYQQVE